jgi:hypothetical protein
MAEAMGYALQDKTRKRPWRFEIGASFSTGTAGKVQLKARADFASLGDGL